MNEDVRTLVRNQLLLAAGSSVLCLAVTGFSAWAWSFVAGAVLITVNFWFL
ncbi:MAG: ATP synthase subunit I, partial [Desulfovibrio sp.]|nr:ATP synthase subunit I [Desulfovibrio sp.]